MNHITPHNEIRKDIRRIINIDDYVLSQVLDALGKVVSNRLSKNQTVKLSGIGKLIPVTSSRRFFDINSGTFQISKKTKVIFRPSSKLTIP